MLLYSGLGRTVVSWVDPLVSGGAAPGQPSRLTTKFAVTKFVLVRLRCVAVPSSDVVSAFFVRPQGVRSCPPTAHFWTLTQAMSWPKALLSELAEQLQNSSDSLAIGRSH